MAKNKERSTSGLNDKFLGNMFTTIGAVGFFFLCMLLPIVGRSAVSTPYYKQNYLSYLLVLLVTLLCSALGWVLKKKRSAADGSPYPKVSLVLTCLYSVMLIILLTGGFNN